jgi:hypothetical protein
MRSDVKLAAEIALPDVEGYLLREGSAGRLQLTF